MKIEGWVMFRRTFRSGVPLIRVYNLTATPSCSVRKWLLADIHYEQIYLLLRSVFCTEIFPENKTLPVTNVPARARENVSLLPTVMQV